MINDAVAVVAVNSALFFRKLHKENKLQALSIAADTTFNVEREGWTYAILTVPVYRLLSSSSSGGLYWRKCGWPIALLRHPAERNSAYQEAFKAVLNEFERRGLPKPQQLHCDYKPGLTRMAKQQLRLRLSKNRFPPRTV